MRNDEYYMNEALKEAMKAYKEDEVPVGCVIVKDDKIINCPAGWILRGLN